jgi:hypothetical protein
MIKEVEARYTERSIENSVDAAAALPQTGVAQRAVPVSPAYLAKKPLQLAGVTGNTPEALLPNVTEAGVIIGTADTLLLAL